MQVIFEPTGESWSLPVFNVVKKKKSPDEEALRGHLGISNGPIMD